MENTGSGQAPWNVSLEKIHTEWDWQALWIGFGVYVLLVSCGLASGCVSDEAVLHSGVPTFIGVLLVICLCLLVPISGGFRKLVFLVGPIIGVFLAYLVLLEKARGGEWVLNLLFYTGGHLFVLWCVNSYRRNL